MTDEQLVQPCRQASPDPDFWQQCPTCEGTGEVPFLEPQHDPRKWVSVCICPDCDGRGGCAI